MRVLTGHLFEVLLCMICMSDRAMAGGFLFSFLAWVCHLVLLFLVKIGGIEVQTALLCNLPRGYKEI